MQQAHEPRQDASQSAASEVFCACGSCCAWSLALGACAVCGQPWCVVFLTVMSIRVTAVRVIVLVIFVFHAVVNSARGPMTKRCASLPAVRHMLMKR